MIRPATLDDLPALAGIEILSFSGDRITRSSYRRLLHRHSATVLVAEEAGEIVGGAVLLFRKGLAAARLYSLAVSPAHRGKGFGRALVDASLEATIARGRLLLRLEVRDDNEEAIQLYRKRGFRPAGHIEDYYEDGATALRLQMSAVEGHVPATSLPVPFYRQTTDFTCGAACLMMALKHFNPKTRLTRYVEIDLWREATTIFMTSGVGGCSAEGMAVAASRHGLVPLVVTSDRDVPFIATVRNAEKKEVIELAHRSFKRTLKELGRPVAYRHLSPAHIRRAVDLGLVVILLVSGYRLYGEKVPHWVVVTGYDEHFVYIHDPYVPDDTPAYEGHHMPIHERDFTRLNRWGARGVRTMVVLGKDAFDFSDLQPPSDQPLS